MQSWRWYSKVLFALLVLAFAYCVWPTPWRYCILERPGDFAFARNRYAEEEDVAGAPGGTFIVRVHRVTGRAYTLTETGRGWQAYKPPRAAE